MLLLLLPLSVVQQPAVSGGGETRRLTNRRWRGRNKRREGGRVSRHGRVDGGLCWLALLVCMEPESRRVRRTMCGG